MTKHQVACIILFLYETTLGRSLGEGLGERAKLVGFTNRIWYHTQTQQLIN
jgi:hypothetical protein